MIDKATPEALSLADSVAEEWATGGISSETIEAVGEKLRRQHARIAELEAEIAAVGTGGVQALSAAPAIGDELRDTLVAVSAAIAERDDRAAQEMIREILAASPAPPAEQPVDPDGEAFRTAARLGLTLRFYGACAQSSMPGTPSAYVVTQGSNPAEAMRDAVEQAAAIIASGGEAPKATLAPPAEQQACDTPNYCSSVQRCTAQDEARMQAVPKAAPGDALDEALRERDDAEDFIDATLDEVLGHERPEWSSSYGRADALNDVQERMTALHKPAVDKAWDQFQSTKAAPKGAAEPAAIVKWQLGGSLVAHLVGDVAEGDLLYKGAPPQPLVREPANWEQLRSALAMAMQGWGSRTDRTAETLNTVLDAITEPDMPLAVLRSAPDWRKWRDAAPLNQRTGPITDNPKPGDKYWDVSGGMAREQTWQGLSPEWDLLDAGALHWDEVSATAALDAAAPQPSPTAQVAAPQQEAVEIPAAIEQMATGRYKVVPSHESMFHRWAVVAGTGTQQLYAGREVECQNMARKFAGAFLDGAFVAMQRTAPNAPAPLSEILDNAEIYKIWFESNSAWHQMIGPKPDRNNHFARAVEAEVLRRAALAAQRGK